MKPNKKLSMQQWKRIAAIVGVLVVVIVAATIVEKRTHRAIKPQQVSSYIKEDKSQSTSLQATSSTKVNTENQSEVNQALGLPEPSSSDGEASTTTNQPSNADIVKTAMQTYTTIALDDGSLDKRSNALKNECTEALYKSLNIDRDTGLLKTMLSEWNKNKTLDTNQPIQLLAQSIISLKVYQNEADNTDYIVVVEEKLVSPASTNTSDIIRQYSVTLTDGKLSALNKTSEVAGKS
ncbi:hypothetical protein [Lactococcus allomyrinae]|uniref:Uncharacterized protein n=1 Tax=Lactococcus allomyrinae TaxID=2419773 RepID=A0A387BFU8_9LACT|nr:hypothetical protein [Lactococcus allomyrinae]AYG01144.1 hypothetical protein D7I46_08575 [Lactococcus allomyrinae]